MTRLATGSGSYSSEAKQKILNAWADMCAAEVEGFDPDAYFQEVEERISDLERDHPELRRGES